MIVFNQFTQSLFVRCDTDECKKRLNTQLYLDEKRAAEIAEEKGWLFFNGRDHCPSCRAKFIKKALGSGSL